MIQVTLISDYPRTYITKDERSAALFSLYFKGKLIKTPQNNWLITI
jgi:hypothetical protein